MPTQSDTPTEHLLEVLDPSQRHLLAPQDWCDICDCPQEVVSMSLETVDPSSIELDPFTTIGVYGVYQLKCGHVITALLPDDPAELFGLDLAELPYLGADDPDDRYDWDRGR